MSNEEKEKERMRDLHDMDQSATFVIDNFPRLWFGLYRQCMEEGFSETQSMSLVKVYMNTTLGVGRFLNGGDYANEFN